jgi:hypothetical protein
MYPALVLYGIVPCVVADPELDLCAASGHTCAEEINELC